MPDQTKPCPMVLVPREALQKLRRDIVDGAMFSSKDAVVQCIDRRLTAMLAAHPAVEEEVITAAVAEARRALTGSTVDRLPSDGAFARAILDHLGGTDAKL